jgi:hypothetical protein
VIPYPGDAVLRARLADHIGQAGLAVDDLLPTVERSFGEPLLASVNGSVLAGFGNPSSDIDIFVVVDRDGLTEFGIQSYDLGVHIDCKLFSADEARRLTGDLARGWPFHATEPVDKVRWRSIQQALLNFSRFALGHALVETPAWRQWLDGLRAPWFVDAMDSWWSAELQRRRLIAAAVRDVNPMLAAMRTCDAVSAALKRRTVERGEYYFYEKWVAQQLIASGDGAGESHLRAALQLPRRPDECHAYTDRMEELLAEIAADVAPVGFQVTLAPGVEVWDLDGTVYLSRWRTRALEVRDPDAAVASLVGGGAGDLAATVGPGESLDELVRQLVVADLVWLSPVVVP